MTDISTSPSGASQNAKARPEKGGPARPPAEPRSPVDLARHEEGVRRFGEALKRQLGRPRSDERPDTGTQHTAAQTGTTGPTEHQGADGEPGASSAPVADDAPRQAPLSQYMETSAWVAREVAEIASPAARGASQASQAEAFAAQIARYALPPDRDERRLRMAFTREGWPVSEFTLTQTADGRMALVLGVQPGQEERVERRLQALRDRLERLGHGADILSLTAVPGVPEPRI